jgi:hypothetical protein
MIASLKNNGAPSSDRSNIFYPCWKNISRATTFRSYSAQIKRQVILMVECKLQVVLIRGSENSRVSRLASKLPAAGCHTCASGSGCPRLSRQSCLLDCPAQQDEFRFRSKTRFAETKYQ